MKDTHGVRMEAIRVVGCIQTLMNAYLIIETDGCSLGWGAVLLAKPHKYSAKTTEKLCRYSSGNTKKRVI